MNVSTTFKSNAKSPKCMYPSVRSFNDPAHFAKPTTVRGATFGNSGHNAVGEQETTATVAIVSAVGEDAPRFANRAPCTASDRGNGFD